MQWDDEHTLGEFKSWLSGNPELQVDLYITAGNEGGLLASTRKLAEELEEHAPDGLRWKFNPMLQEDHTSIPHRGLYEGIEFIFEGWKLRNVAELYDRGGWQAVVKQNKDARERVGYKGTYLQPIGGRLTTQLLGAERFSDVLDFLEARDPKRFPFQPFLFQIIAMNLEKENDTSNLIRNYELMLVRFPNNKTAQKKLEELKK